MSKSAGPYDRLFLTLRIRKCSLRLERWLQDLLVFCIIRVLFTVPTRGSSQLLMLLTAGDLTPGLHGHPYTHDIPIFIQIKKLKDPSPTWMWIYHDGCVHSLDNVDLGSCSFSDAPAFGIGWYCPRTWWFVLQCCENMESVHLCEKWAFAASVEGLRAWDSLMVTLEFWCGFKLENFRNYCTFVWKKWLKDCSHSAKQTNNNPLIFNV